jgi:polyhydroxyalkanoate synthesis regulator phasin
MAAGQQAASVAAEQAGQVTRQAAEQVKDVAGTAVEQARQVGQEASAQVGSLVEQTKAQAHQQAERQTQQLAAALGNLGEQGRALLAGNHEEAGSLPQYGHTAVAKLDEVTRRLQHRGFDGVVADVQNFARRRPGTFLPGAAALGFGLGRLLRGGIRGQTPGATQPDTPGGQNPPIPLPGEPPLPAAAPAAGAETMTPPPPAPPAQAAVGPEWAGR